MERGGDVRRYTRALYRVMENCLEGRSRDCSLLILRYFIEG